MKVWPEGFLCTEKVRTERGGGGSKIKKKNGRRVWMIPQCNVRYVNVSRKEQHINVKIESLD